MCAFVSLFFVLLFSLSLVSFSPCTGIMVCFCVAPFIYSLILFHLHLLGSFFQFLPSLSVLVFFVYTCIRMFFCTNRKQSFLFNGQVMNHAEFKTPYSTAQHEHGVERENSVLKRKLCIWCSYMYTTFVCRSFDLLLYRVFILNSKASDNISYSIKMWINKGDN